MEQIWQVYQRPMIRVLAILFRSHMRMQQVMPPIIHVLVSEPYQSLLPYFSVVLAEKTLLRSWTATDLCGNMASRQQIIKFSNPTRLLGNATLYSVFAYGGANLQSVKFSGQVVAGQNLIGTVRSRSVWF
jgi:hypothetical protein